MNVYRATLVRDGDALSVCTVAENRAEAKRNFLRDYPDFTVYELFLADGEEPDE